MMEPEVAVMLTGVVPAGVTGLELPQPTAADEINRSVASTASCRFGRFPLRRAENRRKASQVPPASDAMEIAPKLSRPESG